MMKKLQQVLRGSAGFNSIILEKCPVLMKLGYAIASVSLVTKQIKCDTRGTLAKTIPKTSHGLILMCPPD